MTYVQRQENKQKTVNRRWRVVDSKNVSDVFLENYLDSVASVEQTIQNAVSAWHPENPEEECARQRAEQARRNIADEILEELISGRANSYCGSTVTDGETALMDVFAAWKESLPLELLLRIKEYFRRHGCFITGVTLLEGAVPVTTFDQNKRRALVIEQYIEQSRCSGFS